ncbi:hypothetical protein DFH06DRAFT_1195318 [Mycena polygramma]|nr:hypothetical protein DFH06DRAFT_1195318 [Mycena polygramma]
MDKLTMGNVERTPLRPESQGTELPDVPEPWTTLQERMSAIEREIAWHYDQIASLKAKRNAMAPICSLPNELMTRILTIFAVETESLFNLKWTKVMYVCHRWHALALAAQPLWGFINAKYGGKRTHRLIIQLKRSGAAPLSLKFHFSDKPFYVDYALEHSQRIAQLEVAGEAQYVYELIGRLSDFEFPILSSLSLDPRYKRDELPEGFIQALPAALLDGRLRNLRELTLQSIAFPWASLSGLESLSLSKCNDSSESPLPGFDGLLQMLSACPQLRNLKLDLCIPPPVPHQLYATVDLPALASLWLCDPVRSCEVLLNHLRLPPSTAIEILLQGVRNGADIRRILVPIRKHVRAPGARKPLLLQIDRNSDSYCTMSLFCDTGPPDLYKYDFVGYPLALNFHPETESALRQILTKVLHAVPSDSITHLDARIGSHMQEASWRGLMRLLPNLETVYLQVNATAVNCVNALAHIEVQDPHHRTFPRIRRLHIRVPRGAIKDGDETNIALLTALEAFLQACATSPDSLVFDDDHYNLSPQEEMLDRLFALMTGEMFWNGIVYDPVERKEQQERLEEERRALFLELGIEM